MTDWWLTDDWLMTDWWLTDWFEWILCLWWKRYPLTHWPTDWPTGTLEMLAHLKIQIHKYSQMWLWKRSVRSAGAQKAYQSWLQQNVPLQRRVQIEGSLSPKRVFEILDLYHGSLYSLLMHYFPSNLRKPEQAVADHMPFITVSDKAFLQMVPKRPYAYCVHVNVYSSKFEHNLKYDSEGLI